MDIKRNVMTIKGKLPRFLIIALSSILILLLYHHAYRIVDPLHLQETCAYVLTNLIICLPVVIVLLLLHKPKDFFHQLGLDGNFVTGMVFFLCLHIAAFYRLLDYRNIES